MRWQEKGQFNGLCEENFLETKLDGQLKSKGLTASKDYYASCFLWDDICLCRLQDLRFLRVHSSLVTLRSDGHKLIAFWLSLHYAQRVTIIEIKTLTSFDSTLSFFFFSPSKVPSGILRPSTRLNTFSFSRNVPPVFHETSEKGKTKTEKVIYNLLSIKQISRLLSLRVYVDGLFQRKKGRDASN